MIETLKKLRVLLTKRDKQFLLFLLFFSIFIAIIETVGISAIMPFISIASNFTLVETNEYYSFLYKFFNFETVQKFVIIFGIILIIFYIFRSGINLFYFYLMAKFTQGRYHLLAFRLFRNYLGFSYRDFTSKNSSNLTKSIVTEANNLTGLISNILLIFSEIFVIIFIYGMLLFVNWKITLILTIILAIKALFLIKTLSKKIKILGDSRALYQQKFYEIINSTFGNFKIIKLFSNENKILNEFKNASFEYARVNVVNKTLSIVPRLFLEAVGFSLMIFVVIYLIYKYNSDIKPTLPIISMYILALYRLLPSFNRIMSGYNDIMFRVKSLDIIHSDLMYNIENLGDKKIKFKDKIELKNILFGFEKDKSILKNLNLTIKKGEKIAFIGESGAGKSTLVDIIIGLYRPKIGNILVDNEKLNDFNIKSLRQKIGYIPQSVYLFDGNVADNVVFGREFYEEKIIQVLKKANIWKFLKEKDGIYTKVGEGGIQLSGGQKQRVAIARAIYSEPEILVLDEATSALDSQTEERIMDEIYTVSSDKTLIIIAHRLSTIQRCEKIYEIKNGQISLKN